MKKNNVWRIIFEYFMVTIAGACNAVSMHVFVNPNKLVPGGFSGLASVIYYIIPSINISYIYIAINIPLLICSLIFVKGHFTFKTIWATVVCTILLRYIPENFIFTNSMLIAVIFGGVCVGFAMHLAAAYGGSNGGTEVIAKIVAKKRPEIDLSKVVFVANLCVLIIGGALLMILEGQSIWVIVYSFIYILCGAKFMGMFDRGFDHVQKFLIVTDKYKELSEVITCRFHRGVTLMDMFDEKGNIRDVKMVMVLCQYRQAAALRQIIKKYDSEAFVIIKDVGDVFSRPTFNRSYRYDKQK